MEFVWQREEAGIRFRDDELVFGFRLPELRLESYRDTNKSVIVGERKPRVSKAAAEATALATCRDLRLDKAVGGTLQSTGHKTSLKNTELLYVNPGNRYLPIQVKDPRFPTEREAVLAWVVTVAIRPPEKGAGVVGFVEYTSWMREPGRS